MTTNLKEPTLLLPALRQYSHNHGEGFVFGYDKAETDRIVAGLIEDRNQQYVMQVGFCEDTALSLAERTFSSEVDERLAEDVIQYARRLHDLYTETHPVPVVEQKPTLVAWILYDATTDVKYIKMNPADGSLAIFDTEEAAMNAKRLTHGTDYDRCEYYTAPQPT